MFKDLPLSSTLPPPAPQHLPAPHSFLRPPLLRFPAPPPHGGDCARAARLLQFIKNYSYESQSDIILYVPLTLRRPPAA